MEQTVEGGGCHETARGESWGTGGRDRDAGGLEDLAGTARRRGSEPEPLAVLLDVDIGEPIEIGEHLRPFLVDSGGLEPILQGLAQDERQVRAEYVATVRIVGLVLDRPCREQ